MAPLAIPLAYFSVLAAGVLWSTFGPSRPEPPLLTAAQVSRLESSLVRCLRRSFELHGVTLAPQDEALIVVYDRDLVTAHLQGRDVDAAPAERIGRRSFIPCSWFKERMGKTVRG